MTLYMYNYYYVGADPCMKHCADFRSDVCNGTNPLSPIYWVVNGQIVGGGNQTSPKTKLSPRLFDAVNGYWMQNLTAYNVCVDPLIIACQQGEEQLLFHNISFCKQIFTLYIVMYDGLTCSSVCIVKYTP